MGGSTVEPAHKPEPDLVRPTVDQTLNQIGHPQPTLSSPVAGLIAGAVRRLAKADDPLGGSAVPTNTLDILRRRRGGGQPLPDDVARPFGEHLGTDLSHVRVHHDAESASISRSLQATAFTHGSDIYFSQGAFNPGSSTGQHVLAHELAHVVQQSGPSTGSSSGGTTIGRANDPAEAQADATANSMLQRLRAAASHPAHQQQVQRTTGKPVALSALRRQAASRRQPVTLDAAAHPLRRLEAVHGGSNARKRLKAEWEGKGWGSGHWSELADGIGASTILDTVGVERLHDFLIQQSYNVGSVVRIINAVEPAELPLALAGVDTATMLAEQALLIAPNEQQMQRAYAAFLLSGRNGTDLGLAAAYVQGMYNNFTAAMLANGGRYWDHTAGRFQVTSAAFRAAYAAAPVAGAAFSGLIYNGQQVVMGTGALIVVPGWQANPNMATGLEFATFLGNTAAVTGIRSRFDAPMRAVIAEIFQQPALAQSLIANPDPLSPLSRLVDAVVAAPVAATFLTVLEQLILPAGTVLTPRAFANAMNHLPVVIAAAPALLNLRSRALNSLPFGTRGTGLLGHFLKHPLGRVDPAYAATGLWEAGRWAALLGLAPNGLITRAHLATLPTPSQEEWSIFGQHSQLYPAYAATPDPRVAPAAAPTTPAETAALHSYLQDLANLADATAIAVAFQAQYEHHVSQAFDATPLRFVHYDAGVLKVNASAADLFMVAATAGPTFNLSTGFLIQGGSQASYDADLNNRIAYL